MTATKTPLSERISEELVHAGIWPDDPTAVCDSMSADEVREWQRLAVALEQERDTLKQRLADAEVAHVSVVNDYTLLLTDTLTMRQRLADADAMPVVTRALDACPIADCDNRDVHGHEVSPHWRLFYYGAIIAPSTQRTGHDSRP